MHERSPKSVAMDTLLYERDMLSHCARTVNLKRERWRESRADHDEKEYYLCIEGFLLHFRNLLGFLVNKGDLDSDLRLGKPETWASIGHVEARNYSDLVKRAKKINKQYGTEDPDGSRVDCYRQISRFLQHPTTYRHTLPRSWAIEKMHADIASVLDEFFARFAPNTVRNLRPILGDADQSTATKYSI